MTDLVTNLTPLTMREKVRGMKIGMRHWFDKHADVVAFAIARRLPRRVRQWAVVDAAVKAREPERLAGDQYCGPDGLTYKDLYDAASTS